MILGLDIGISSTKLALLEGDGRIADTGIWEGTFSPEILCGRSGFSGIEKVALTGVGGKSLGDSLCGIPAVKVDEFDANAAAGRIVRPSGKCIVVSMGTGTSFVLLDGEKSEHLGGSALGGGTLISLFHLAVPGGDWALLRSLAPKGDLSRVDIQIGDVCTEGVPGLPPDITASNLGKATMNSCREDLTAGLVNIVLQNIGVMACLAGKARGVRDFVLIGRLASLPLADRIFARLETLHGVRFIIPELPEYMTAAGAAASVL